MKKFSQPMVEIVKIDADIICASGKDYINSITCTEHEIEEETE